MHVYTHNNSAEIRSIVISMATDVTETRPQKDQYIDDIIYSVSHYCRAM